MVALKTAILTLTWAASLGAATSAPHASQKPPLDRDHIWRVERDEVLVRGRRVDRIRGDASEIVRAINTVLAAVALEYGGPVAEGEPGPPTIRLLGVGAGTARVEVIGAEYLCERMGTTGAEHWLAAATFTLTEIPGVNAIEFLFEEGSHASPGRYTRAGFARFKRVGD